MSRPSLHYLQIAELIAHAGGDPWAVDDSLQAGSPTQIKQHFQHYNRENGQQPINNGARSPASPKNCTPPLPSSATSPPTWRPVRP